MSKLRKFIWFSLIALVAAWPLVPARPAAAQGAAPGAGGEGILVGRISHVDGQLLRYVPSEKDWVETVKDAPFGLDDALYSGDNGKAEFIMPNSTWVRIGASTQVQLITLKDDVTEVDVASGVARFYNRSSNGVIKATTPFGFVMAPAGTVFDLYVGDQSVEVIAIKGSVDYVHEGDETKYEVVSGSTSIVADNRQVTSGEGNVDADWDSWNADRDQLWARKLEVKGDSVNYLPSQLHDEASTLEENGRWERVYYEGGYHEFWRPVSVSAGWAPFTVGHWTDWYGDNVWIPDEPFGYVTHHYGNWVYANNFWYWSPPVVSVGVAVGPPVYGIGFGWYPGRVAWISSGVDVGWVPLAPTEIYYSHWHWGPSAVVVAGPVAAVNINVGGLAFVSHAVVVPQTHFFGVANYSSVRVTNINKTTIINNYHASPVVNNTVIKNYDRNPQRFKFTNVNVTTKPHDSVLNRIQRNQTVAKQATRVNATEIKRTVATAKPGQAVHTAAVQPPKISDKLVPASQVNKPVNQVQFKQKQIKQTARPPQASVGQPGAGMQGKPGVRQPRAGQTPGVQPGQAARPGQPARPSEGVQRPPRPGERMAPGESRRPGQPARPSEGVQRPPRPGERMAPGESRRPGQPARPSEGVQRPPRPGERMAPGEPARPSESFLRPQRQPSERPQRAIPSRPSERMQPGAEARQPGNQRMQPRREQMPQGGMGLSQHQQQRPQMQERSVRRPPAEQQREPQQRGPAHQQVPPGERKRPNEQ